MKNAIWFSRHQPTAEQRSEIHNFGLMLCGVDEGINAGSISINSDLDTGRVLTAIETLAREHNATDIFGVFPTPLLAVSNSVANRAVERGDYCSRTITLWASWNVQRTSEGEKPTFIHKRWLAVGQLEIVPL